MLPAGISEPTVDPIHDYRVDYVQGFDKDHLILIAAEDGTCLLKQVSNVTPGMLEHRTGNFNPPGSFGPKLNAKTAVFNLGKPGAIGGPVWRTFYVANNKLQAEDLLGSLAAGAPVTRELVEDIVDLQAQYGKDKIAADGIVDTWETVPPGEGEWPFVLAVRVGVLARSQNYEKPATPGDPCTATQAAPTWSGGAFTVPDGLPSCYKYRVFETVIPLRNVIWKQE
jgi:type IV pilus assembly protein PilW